MNVAVTATAHDQPKPAAPFTPREFNSFEEQMTEAWRYPAIVYPALDAWMTVAHGDKQRAIDIMINARKRGLSPISAFNEIRELVLGETNVGP